MKVLPFFGLVLCLSASVNALVVINEPSVIVYETPKENGHIEDIIRYGTVIDIAIDDERLSNGYFYYGTIFKRFIQ